jgi:fimbrial chaperone protein
MKFTLRPVLLALFLILMGIQPSFAFKLLPISRTFAPAGRNATQSYEIVNDRNERLAVSVSMVQRQMDQNGKESYKPADDDFMIYPPQILLEPNTTQTVRVSWVGDPNPAAELSYRLIAEQVPVNLDKNQSQVAKPVGAVQILIRYLGSVFVKSDIMKSDVVLKTIETLPGATGAKQLAITMHNQGNAHVALTKLALHLKAGGSVVDLKPDQLKGMANEVLLAGNTRRFVIPYPAGLPQGAVTATFEFGQK